MSDLGWDCSQILREMALMMGDNDFEARTAAALSRWIEKLRTRLGYSNGNQHLDLSSSNSCLKGMRPP